jgi:glycosyltransferase involved in cell wall biosynthesis
MQNSNLKRVAIVTNIAWNLFNFRRGLAKAIKDAGYEPVLIAAPDAYSKRLVDEGWHFIPMQHLERTGVNPVKDLLLLKEFIDLYREQNIKFALHYNAKPLVYASLAAAALKIPYIATITGLAGPFTGNRAVIRQIVTVLYRLAFSRCQRLGFQNKEDLKFFLDKKMISKTKTFLVEGSGVNMDDFRAELYGQPPVNKTVFLMFARLSWAKGVKYYFEAAKIIKAKYPNVVFKLAGPFDGDSLSISKHQIDEWHNSGFIEYIGVSDFIQREISEAHVIVYPSYYREGIPRSLIESAAMSRPIITTDNVGCREVVNDGVNGYLVPVKNSVALAQAFEQYLNLTNEQKSDMGNASRKIALERFDERLILSRYLSFIREKLKT